MPHLPPTVQQFYQSLSFVNQEEIVLQYASPVQQRGIHSGLLNKRVCDFQHFPYYTALTLNPR